MKNILITFMLLIGMTVALSAQEIPTNDCGDCISGDLTCVTGPTCSPQEHIVDVDTGYRYCVSIQEDEAIINNVTYAWTVINGNLVNNTALNDQYIDIQWNNNQLTRRVFVDVTVTYNNGNPSVTVRDSVAYDESPILSLPDTWPLYNCRTDTIDADNYVAFSDKLQLSYEWTKVGTAGEVGSNGVMIRDESHLGTYLLSVTRNGGCVSTQEMPIERVYPTINDTTANLDSCRPQDHDPIVIYPEDSLHDFLRFTWKNTEGNLMSNDIIDVVDYAGTYTFEIQEKGCIGDPTYDSTHVFPIVIGNIPELNLNFEEDVNCFPDVTLTSTYATYDSLIELYEWGIDDSIYYSNTNTKTYRPYDHHIVFPGTYRIYHRIEAACGVWDTVSHEVTYTGLQVVDTALVDSLYRHAEVLGVGVGTFTNSRLMDLTGHTEMRGRSGYENGQLGTWRTDASYAYVKDRSSSAATVNAELDLSKDGTFDYGGFSWNYAAKKLADGWRHTATITKYDAFGTELENRDILGIHSAALYDCKGERETAVGANARYFELAFTGFEEYEGIAGVPRIGNFNLLKDSTEIATTLDIISGNGNKVIFEWPYAQIDALKDIEFTVAGKPIGTTLAGFAEDSVLLGNCHSPHPTKDSLMIAYFGGPGGAILEEQRLWTGEMLFYTDKFIGYTSGLSISDDKAHTGKKSLKITASSQALRQETLNLEAGEEYVISVWVSVKISSLTENLSMETQFNAGLELGLGSTTLNFQPTGTIVNGWQRLEGKFTVPENLEEAMTIKFKNSGNYQAVYFDDLRLFPADGNMQSYVYDTKTYRLKATLDNNNYASLYFYDAEGNLRIVKKETERGIKTIQEVSANQPQTNN